MVLTQGIDYDYFVNYRETNESFIRIEYCIPITETLEDSTDLISSLCIFC